MTLEDLKIRVQETTGMEVITRDSLNTCVRLALADMTSRGYREYKEEILEVATDVDELTKTKYSFELPVDVKSILRLKIKHQAGVDTAARISLSNPAIDADIDRSNSTYKVDFTNLNTECVYYVKNDTVYVELAATGKELSQITLHYYKRLLPPEWVDDNQNLDEATINVRDDLVEALVLYCCYFYYTRYLRDVERTQAAYAQYKYFMEDILHELNREDVFYEGDSVIITEE